MEEAIRFIGTTGSNQKICELIKDYRYNDNNEGIYIERENKIQNQNIEREDINTNVMKNSN